MLIFDRFIAWLKKLDQRLLLRDPRSDTILARIDSLERKLQQINADVITNRQATAQKTHQLSNFMMGVENKVDELAALIMLDSGNDD